MSRNRTVLVTDLSGRIGEGNQGLWVMETRMVSRHEWLFDGRALQSAGASAVGDDRWQGYFLAPAVESATDPAEQALELHVGRTVGDGMYEDVELVNHTQQRVRAVLQLRLDADFAAPQDVQQHRKPHGEVTREWRDGGSRGVRELRFEHRAEHATKHAAQPVRIHRVLALRLENSDSPARRHADGLAFDVDLAPHRVWRARLTYVPTVEGRELQLLDENPGRAPSTLGVSLTTPPLLADVVVAAFDRALEDLAALRLRDLDLPDDAWTVVGGLPNYVAFFGRDTLVVGLQAALVGPELLRGALEHLARTQADRVDDWRDAQPGRMVHELHTDPRSALLYEPHGRYYGDVTSSVLYPVALLAHWFCAADERVLRRHVEPAIRAMAWADSCARKTDGFFRYETRSAQGEKNQGWKDSSEAIVWPDGRRVDDPLGTCEMQSNVYWAKRSLGAVLRVLGRRDEARRLFREARALKHRFQRTFWMEDEGWIGQAVDARGDLVRTVSSDGADCLVSGIVGRRRAERLVERLFAPDVFSGWGIRTLSSQHPAYSPISYQRGSVWPVENAAIAVGLARYGFVAELHRLCRAQFEAAALFDEVRLPELFGGHPRDDEHPFPGLYPRANWPQAWSASAVIAMVNAMLGIAPDVPRKRLIVDPHLPPWLPELTVRGIRVGGATVTLRFVREPGGTTRCSVERLTGELRIVAR